MIRRKNSFGYIDFIRGKYIQNNLDHLQSMFNEMSIEERELIRTCRFDELWKTMWGISESNFNQNTQFKIEELSSQKKFEALKNGIPIGINGEIITLYNLIDNSTTKWSETEWEFPKGRKNFQEKDLDCALREFEEETGISKKHIKIVENVLPFEEIFLGSNHKSYKHKYFLGYSENTTEYLNNYQQSEVSKIEWKTLDECLASIRPYNLEKKQIISNINKVLQEYRLY
jgi:8-oxo-dGTP pyrophosphatase MutT (NUDIX family)